MHSRFRYRIITANLMKFANFTATEILSMISLRSLLTAAAFAAALINGRAMVATDLRCEYMTDPLALDCQLPPRLSWVPDDGGRRGAMQGAYRIMVASSPEMLAQGKADVWDSGKVPSGMTAHIPCGGEAARSFDRRYWRVMLWDEEGTPGPWSGIGSWETGVLAPADWQGAQWIAYKPTEVWEKEWRAHKERELPGMADSGPIRTYAGLNLWQIYDSVTPTYDPAPMMRREFDAPADLTRATLYICGLGYFEASVNGNPVSADVLNPAWTIFDETALYCTYDITPLLRAGSANAIGVTLGRGQLNPICNDAWGLWKTRWVSQPRLMALLRLERARGKVEYVVTDSTWRTAGGPTVFDDTRLGEIYDARLEQPGWDAPGFDDRSWVHASEVEWPMETLKAQTLPPVRRHGTLPSLRRIDREGGEALFDIGQNIAGWARVRVRGPEGARVLVEYCELPSDTLLVPELHPARMEMRKGVTDPHYAAFYDATTEVRQQNAYILRGDADGEEFECRFSYKGFRFARVTAQEGVTVERLEGVPVHSDLRATGVFECSDSTVNRLQRMARLTMLNNFMGIPTDCPHREKQGWTADGYFTAPAAMYNFDMAQFYSKWMRDLKGTQTSEGALCTVAPSVGYDEGVSVTWPAALLYVSSDLYDFYGERRLLSELYRPMQLFAEHARTHELPGRPEMMAEVLGDWVSPADSILPSLRGSSILAPPEGVNTYAGSSYYSILRHLRRFAALTGHDADTLLYAGWADRVRRDFNRAFFRPSEAAYYGHIPTPYRLAPNAVALMEGLVPDSMRNAVGRRFADEVAAGGYTARTGFLGTRAMMKWLPVHDPEAAWQVATQPRYPGWGYMAAQGATTMWEDWAACASVDHMPYCLISEYFYRHLAGISVTHGDDGRPVIDIAPTFVSGLSWARASYRSLYGTIASGWRRTPDGIALSVEIPANCTARLRLPDAPAATLSSGTHEITLPPGAF